MLPFISILVKSAPNIYIYFLTSWMVEMLVLVSRVLNIGWNIWILPGQAWPGTRRARCRGRWGGGGGGRRRRGADRVPPAEGGQPGVGRGGGRGGDRREEAGGRRRPPHWLSGPAPAGQRLSSRCSAGGSRPAPAGRWGTAPTPPGSPTPTPASAALTPCWDLLLLRREKIKKDRAAKWRR